MTPRITTRLPPRQATSYEMFKINRQNAPAETRAFWNWVTVKSPDGTDARELIEPEELRVLSKAASGGGYLVPTDVSDMVIAAARASSTVAQLAFEIVTDTGATLGMALGGTHGTAAWVAESGTYTPSDETVTQANLGAYKSASKIIVSEELAMDSAVELDAYLSFELGARLGALQEVAFCAGDGSGKPLGLVHASSPYPVVNAATGSSTLFKLADLMAVYKALPSVYRANASWLMAADDLASLAGTADTAGGVLPSLQFDPPSLFGRPVYIGELPAPGANAKSVVFADFKRAYGIRRVNGIVLRRQDELHADTGQIGFKAFARVDGRPLLADAARILAHSAT